MSLIDSLEKRFGSFAITHLTLHWIIAQIAVFVLSLLKPEIIPHFVFSPAWVVNGDFWRLLSFMLAPPAWPTELSLLRLLVLIITWYMLWFMGRELEAAWGSFRYTAFVLTSWLLTVVLAFFAPLGIYHNWFILSLVFLSFTAIRPDFEVMLFFVLPVKLKWLGIFTWVSYGFLLVFSGQWNERLMVLAIGMTYVLFFQEQLRNQFDAIFRAVKRR